MGFLAIFSLLLGWNLKLDRGSILERGLGSKWKNPEILYGKLSKEKLSS
jgi:hypothetical protein